MTILKEVVRVKSLPRVFPRKLDKACERLGEVAFEVTVPRMSPRSIRVKLAKSIRDKHTARAKLVKCIRDKYPESIQTKNEGTTCPKFKKPLIKPSYEEEEDEIEWPSPNLKDLIEKGREEAIRKSLEQADKELDNIYKECRKVDKDIEQSNSELSKQLDVALGEMKDESLEGDLSDIRNLLADAPTVLKQ